MIQDITRHRIIIAFIELLAETAYSKISIKDIMDHSGLSRNVFYNYFSNKAELVNLISARTTATLYRDLPNANYEDIFDKLGFIIAKRKEVYCKIAPIKLKNDLYFELHTLFYEFFLIKLKRVKIMNAIDPVWLHCFIDYFAHLSSYAVIKWIKCDKCSTPLTKYYGEPDNLFCYVSPFLPIFTNDKWIERYLEGIHKKSPAVKDVFDSLKTISQRKPVTKITVSEISDYCNLTRNGFYYHFYNIYDMLLQYFTSNISAFFLEEKEYAYSKTFDFINDNLIILSPEVFKRTQNSIGTHLFNLTSSHVYEYVQGIGGIAFPQISGLTECISYASLQSFRGNLYQTPKVPVHVFSTISDNLIEAITAIKCA